MEKADPSDGLDDLQRAILWLVAQGRTSVQVARELAISEATMRRSLRRARDRLGATNTPNAVYIATKRGLI